MFTPISSFQYQRKSNRELVWTSELGSEFKCTLAGAALGGEILRIRAQRGTQLDETRYQLPDGLTGTLPYHSWSIIKGDEQWPDVVGEAEARTLLEPYFSGIALSSTAIRLTRPLADEERIYGLGERTGPMNKRGEAFPIWNIDPPIHHRTETITMYTSIPFYLG